MSGGLQSFSFSLLLQVLIRNNLLLFSLLVAVPVSVQAEEAASSDLGAAISVVSGGGGANIGGDANTVEGVGKGAGGPGDGDGPGNGAGQGLGGVSDFVTVKRTGGPSCEGLHPTPISVLEMMKMKLTKVEFV